MPEFMIKNLTILKYDSNPYLTVKYIEWEMNFLKHLVYGLLGTSAERCGGSTPSIRTKIYALFKCSTRRVGIFISSNLTVATKVSFFLPFLTSLTFMLF